MDLWTDALSKVIIHSENEVISEYFIAYFKMHRYFQNFSEFPVSSTINERNSPFDVIAVNIDHLPVRVF